MKGGCALYISKKIKNSCRLPQLEITNDLIWVLVDLGNLKLVIGCVYVHDREPLHLQSVLESCNAVDKFVTDNKLDGMILLGDFNSRSTLWGDNQCNKMGNDLSLFMNSSDSMMLVSPGENTFSCTKNKIDKQGGSIIDLIICSTKLATMFSLCTVDENATPRTGAPARGHWPVLSKLRTVEIIQRENLVSEIMDLKNYDWERWKEDLDNHVALECQEEDDEAITLWKKLQGCLERTRSSIPIKRVCMHSKPYWSKELSLLSQLLQVARKAFNKLSTPTNLEIYNNAKEAFDAELSKAFNRWTEESTKELLTKDKSKFWKAYNKNLKKQDVGRTVDILKSPNNNFIYSDDDKCSLFHETFFTGNHLKGCNFDEEFKTQVENEVQEIMSTDNVQKDDRSNRLQDEPEDQQDLNKPFTLSELNSAISKMQTSRKALDGEGIHPLFIKKSGITFRQTLLKLLNKCLDEEFWPWKTSKVIILKKSGKTSYQDPGAYRPISLTSYVGKVMERLLESRLREFLVKNDLLDEEQEGFQKGKSTTRYLYRLASKISSTRNRKLVGILLLADFEKAYDSVWVQGLLYKLSKVGIKGKMWGILANYLLDREIYIQVGKTKGKTITCSLGLPQGSVISPLLFIFYVADMCPTGKTKGETWKYADDASILTQNSSKDNARKDMQHNLDNLHQWISKWRFKLNCSKGKTEAIAINFTPTAADELKFGNSIIEYVEESKVLGIWIDGKLSWKRQVREVVGKCWGIWKIIKAHCSPFKGLRMHNILTLVRIAVLPILFYASPVWLTGNEEEFKSLWYDILKTTTGTPSPFYKASKGKMEVITSFPPIEIQSKIIIVKFITKNFYQPRNNTIFVKEIERVMTEERRHHFAKQHINFLKEYICHQTGLKTHHSIDLNNRIDPIRYSKKSIWEFTLSQWKGQIAELDQERDFRKLLTNTHRTRVWPCKRLVEVLMCAALLTRLPTKQFLWEKSLVSSPVCNCKKSEETIDHLLFECEELNNIREFLKVKGQTVHQAIIEPDTACIFQMLDIISQKKHFLKLRKLTSSILKEPNERKHGKEVLNIVNEGMDWSSVTCGEIEDLVA